MRKRYHIQVTLFALMILAVTACGTAKPQETAAVTEPAKEEVELKEKDAPQEETVEEEPAQEPVFADITADHPMYQTIVSAKKKGLLEGFIDGPEFQPDEPLENVDIPLLFWNLAGRPEAELSVDIANLDELNEEEAMAVKWYYGAYRGFMFSQGKQPVFFEPKEPAKSANFSNAKFLATERFGMDDQALGGYTVVHLDEENSAQVITRAEAIKELDDLTKDYPVGTEFVKDLPDDLMALVTECDPAKKTVEVAKAEPTKTEPAPSPKETQQTVPPPAATPTPEEIAAAQAAATAQAQAAAEAAAAQAAASIPPAPAKEEPKTEVAKTEPAPNPKETQQTVPPPAATPTPEEIAAAQAAAAAQAQAAAEAAAQAQAQAEAEAQAKAAAEAQAAAEAAAIAQAQAAAEAAAAQAAAQATGNMSDAQWVRDQIAATAEAYGFTCSQPVGGTGTTKLKIVIIANDSSRKWRHISLAQQHEGNWRCGVYTDITGDSAHFTPSSVDEIKKIISSYAY